MTFADKSLALAYLNHDLIFGCTEP